MESYELMFFLPENLLFDLEGFFKVLLNIKVVEIIIYNTKNVYHCFSHQNVETKNYERN